MSCSDDTRIPSSQTLHHSSASSLSMSCSHKSQLPSLATVDLMLGQVLYLIVSIPDLYVSTGSSFVCLFV